MMIQFSIYNLKFSNEVLSLRGKRGFTLIELLVVVSVIGVLVGLLSVALQGAKASSRDARRKADLEDIKSALEIYRADCGTYPTTDLSWGSVLTASCTGSSNTYMSKVPQDTLNSAMSYKYEYVYNSTNKTYTLCAFLENGSTGALCAAAAGKNCGNTSKLCNYSIANP